MKATCHQRTSGCKAVVYIADNDELFPSSHWLSVRVEQIKPERASLSEPQLSYPYVKGRFWIPTVWEFASCGHKRTGQHALQRYQNWFGIDADRGIRPPTHPHPLNFAF